MLPKSVVGHTFSDRYRRHGDGCMEPDLRKGHDVRGLTPLRGTWIAIAIMSPVVVAQIAFAVPGYFAPDVPDGAVTTTYDTPDDAVPLTTSTTEGIAAPRVATEAPDSTTGLPGNSTEVTDGAVNHGQVMKQLQELTDGPASGCLTSAVARSDLGKGNRRDRTDETSTTLSQSFADEFDCTSAKAREGDGSGKVSKDTATKRPDKRNNSNKKDPAKPRNRRGKSDK